MRVLRQSLDVVDYQQILLPVPDHPPLPEKPVLHVAPCRTGLQRIDLWHLDTDRQRDAGIYIVGTGNPMPKALAEYRVHLGTCVMPSGLVWHVFEGPVQL